MRNPPSFDDTFRDQFRNLIAWRRDVRRFRADLLPQGTLERLLEWSLCAPSVGLSQPWRFVIVDNLLYRSQIGEVFKACNATALASYSGETAQNYAKLKLAGLEEAPCHIAVFADRKTPLGRGLGQMTMPQMAEYSTVTAIHTLWLLARAEDIGMGWISILDPARVAKILDVSQEWQFIAYLCLGYPAQSSDTPELEREGWEKRHSYAEFLLRR